MQVRGDIEFSNVKFSYPTRPDRVVLHGLSLTIAAGHTVAIVGPSGSGKLCIINDRSAVHSEP
jgi:ABC-type multidrug transport system fused ATPase/permease subunit